MLRNPLPTTNLKMTLVVIIPLPKSISSNVRLVVSRDHPPPPKIDPTQEFAWFAVLWGLLVPLRKIMPYGIQTHRFATIKRVPKHHCTSRAEWRLQPGKPAKALSAHYRLDCDYGTTVITCWEDGGSEPIYVCESHAKQLGPSRGPCSDVRILTNAPDNPIKTEDQTRIQGIAAEEPKDRASSEASRSPADAKVGPGTTDPSVSSPARDLTYGNSAKAMVDEAIWNMAAGNCQAYRTALQQGKSATEAAQAAGGQLAVVHRKISDYTVKLEAVLSESKARINVVETIDKPLEHAVLEIISNGAMSDSEKDLAIQQLGALQEWAKHGLEGDITPLQANQIILSIGDRQNWGRNGDVTDEFKPVCRALFSSLKTAIVTAVPESQNLHDRLTNLYAVKSGLEVC